MAGFSRIEEINAWVKARELCKEVYEIINKDSFEKDYALKRQIDRASGSIMDNIAEGFERGGRMSL